MKNKPHVIFIQSAGHSGSTLLDMIIGTDDNSLSLGEIRQWNKYFTKDNSHPEPNHEKQRFDTCTCGANLDTNECPLWNKIIFKHIYNLELLEQNLKKYITGYYAGYYNLDDIAPRNHDYLRILYLLKLQTGCDTFIDSSKSLQWLLMLTRYYKKGYIDLTVILLSRHPCGVYYSHKKINRNPKRELFLRKFTNKARNLIVKSERIPCVRLTYEELVKNNEKAVEKLESIGLNLKNWQEKIKTTQYHLIGGNPMRFEKFKSLEYDNRWKKNLNLLEKLFCKIMR